MMYFLNVLRYVLYIAEFLAIFSLLVITGDYLLSEYQEWKGKTERVVTSTKRTLYEVDMLIQQSQQALAKAKLRERKEAEARESFFQEGYYRGFDKEGRLIYRGGVAPSNPNWDFYTRADQLADAQIFENTEVI